MSYLTPVREAFEAFGDRVASFLPYLVTALVLLAIGWLVSWLVAGVVRRLIQRLRFDDFMAQTGWSASLESSGVQAKPSVIVSWLVFWTFMTTFLVLALQNLGLEHSALLLRDFVEYLPRIVGAALLVFVGAAFAMFAGTAMGAALARIHFAQHRLMASVLRGLILLVAVVAAIEHLGFDVSFLTQTLTNLVTIFAAALAVTFALGGGDAARNILAGYYARERFKAGDRLEVDNESGELLGIGTLTSELRTDNGHVVFPNRRLVETAVRRLDEG
jgi:small-conductance mechanosensitive channel